MVPKCELFENIFVHVQELNYKEIVYEFENHDEEEALSSNLLPKLKPTKRTPINFINHLLENI
jgi:hypothetical protein